MNQPSSELNALEEALRPLKGLDDPRALVNACTPIVREHVEAAGMLAAVTIYRFEGIALTSVLTVTDPEQRSFLARLLPAKKVQVPSADALNVILQVAIQQVVNPSVANAVSTYVFALLHEDERFGVSREGMMAMGRMTVWMAFQHAREAVAVANRVARLPPR